MIALSLLACGPPADTLEPPPAALLIEQLRLPGPAIGEAALVVTDDGHSALIDVGNDSHTDAVVEALEHHLGVLAVDHVVLTHFHADHIGGFEDLIAAGLVVREGVWHRGVHALDDANADELAPIEAFLAANPALDRPLCDAEACPGLAALPLGEATLHLIAADGRVTGAEGQAPVAGDENARSVVGVVARGDFRWAFGGDLTGGGKDTPDAEAFIAARWPAALAPVDALQLNHHGINSSSFEPWLDRLLPNDGATRHALVGSNGGYLAAPDDAVLERVVPRLGEGFVATPQPGSLAGRHARLVDADGAVLLRLGEDGEVLLTGREGALEWALAP